MTPVPTDRSLVDELHEHARTLAGALGLSRDTGTRIGRRYRTAHFHAWLEAQARANLQRALQALRG
jgi:hypothetical protein